MSDIRENARLQFERFADLAEPELPADLLSALQVLLARHESKAAGKEPLKVAAEATISLAEISSRYFTEHQEVANLILFAHISAGEISKNVLKDVSSRTQKALCTQIGELVMCLMTLCTRYSLDFGTIVKMSVNELVKEKK